MKKIKKRTVSKIVKSCIAFILFLSLMLPNIGITEAKADRSGDCAFIAVLYDDATMSWRTVVFTSSEDIERNWITRYFYYNTLEFIQSPSEYRDFAVKGTYQLEDSSATNTHPYCMVSLDEDGTVDIVCYDGSNFCDDYEDVWGKLATKSTPLTFPSNSYEASESDINRAYSISATLGTSLNDAVQFLNEGKSFEVTAAGESYFFELTHKLLSAENGQRIMNTHTGMVYQVYWGIDGENTCTIRKVAKGEKLDSGEYSFDNIIELDRSEIEEEQFTYRMRKGYYYSEYAASEIVAARNQIYAYQILNHGKTDFDANGYVYQAEADTPYVNGDSSLLGFDYLFMTAKETDKSDYSSELYSDKLRFDEDGDDGTLNTLDKLPRYAGDTEYINWFQMVLEAQMLRTQGITYANQNDLITVQSEDSAFVKIVRNLLDGLRSLLNCYSLDQLVYNSGTRGSLAYYGGMFPSYWLENIELIYLICTVIALSLLGVAFAKAVIQQNLSTIMPSMRASLMDDIKNIFVVAFLVSFFFVFLSLIIDLNVAFVDIFAETSASSRFKSLQSTSNGTGTIAGVIIQFAYFFLVVWLNVVYIIRGIELGLLIASSPLFMLGLAFGNKGREITAAWFSEFIGTLLIQPVHALVITFLMSVNIGLRGIEGIVFTACLIPLTNLVKSLTGRGGGLASKLGSSLTAGGLGMATSVTAGAMGAVGAGLSSGSRHIGVGHGGGEYSNPLDVSTNTTAATKIANMMNSAKNPSGQYRGTTGGINMRSSGDSIASIGKTGRFAQLANKSASAMSTGVNLVGRGMQLGSAGLQVGSGAGMFAAMAGADGTASAMSMGLVRSGVHEGSVGIRDTVSEVKDFGANIGNNALNKINESSINSMDNKLAEALNEPGGMSQLALSETAHGSTRFGFNHIAGPVARAELSRDGALISSTLQNGTFNMDKFADTIRSNPESISKMSFSNYAQQYYGKSLEKMTNQDKVHANITRAIAQKNIDPYNKDYIAKIDLATEQNYGLFNSRFGVDGNGDYAITCDSYNLLNAGNVTAHNGKVVGTSSDSKDKILSRFL